MTAPNVARLADEHAAAVTARELMGARTGYGSPEWYEAQAEVVRAHTSLVAALCPEFAAHPGLSEAIARCTADYARATGSAEPPDYAADVGRLCEHAVRAAQANAVCRSAEGTAGEDSAWTNLHNAEQALKHAKCQMRTTLEQLREMAVRS